MNTIKILGISLLAAILVLAIATFASAAPTVTLRMPVAGILTANVTGHPWNASATENLSNCTLYGYSTDQGTGNISDVAISSTLWPTIGNDTSVNGTFNMNNIDDDDNWKLRAFCCNNSGNTSTTPATACAYSSYTTGITINKGAPIVPDVGYPDGITIEDDDVTVWFNGSAANQTHCTVTFTGTNPGKSAYGIVDSTGNCSVTFTNIPEGVYDYQFKATDNTDTTGDSQTYTFTIDRTSGAGKAVYYSELYYQQEQQQETKNKRTILLLLLAVIIIVIFIRNKNKK